MFTRRCCIFMLLVIIICWPEIHKRQSAFLLTFTNFLKNLAFNSGEKVDRCWEIGYGMRDLDDVSNGLPPDSSLKISGTLQFGSMPWALWLNFGPPLTECCSKKWSERRGVCCGMCYQSVACMCVCMIVYCICDQLHSQWLSWASRKTFSFNTKEQKIIILGPILIHFDAEHYTCVWADVVKKSISYLIKSKGKRLQIYSCAFWPVEVITLITRVYAASIQLLAVHRTPLITGPICIFSIKVYIL